MDIYGGIEAYWWWGCSPLQHHGKKQGDHHSWKHIQSTMAAGCLGMEESTMLSYGTHPFHMEHSKECKDLWCGDDGWASWMMVVVVVEEEERIDSCWHPNQALANTDAQFGWWPWDTECMEVRLLSFNGHMVQLEECSLICAHDMLWSQVFGSLSWQYF